MNVSILEHANLILAHLEHAKLTLAHLEHAKLIEAHLEHAALFGAHLDGADVRGTKGLLLDDNPADRMRIEGDAPDPWSVLRRKYTGPWFFVHLLLLLLFFAPYGGRILYLSAVAGLHDRAMTVEQRLDTKIGQTTEPMRDWYRIQQDKFRSSHQYTRAVWVLIGVTDGILFLAMAAAITLYNLTRAYLTLAVSTLRDAEERARITPSLSDYYGPCHPLSERPGWRNVPGAWWKKWQTTGFWANCNPRRLLLALRLLPQCVGLYRLHWCASRLLWASLVAFAINAFYWVWFTRVWVPINP